MKSSQNQCDPQPLPWALAGEEQYLNAAHQYWKRTDTNIFPSWDSAAVPAVTLLLGAAARGVALPGKSEYTGFMENTYLPAWQQGGWEGFLDLMPFLVG
jgi:hypothetical protein